MTRLGRPISHNRLRVRHGDPSDRLAIAQRQPGEAGRLTPHDRSRSYFIAILRTAPVRVSSPRTVPLRTRPTAHHDSTFGELTWRLRIMLRNAPAGESAATPAATSPRANRSALTGSTSQPRSASDMTVTALTGAGTQPTPGYVGVM